MRTQIKTWGNSQGIRIPKSLLESVNITEHDKLDIVADNDNIIIKKANRTRHQTLRERFSNEKYIYEKEDINWGSPVGNEIW